MKTSLFLMMLVSLFLRSPAVFGSEEIDYNGVGLRAGMTVRPDQIHFGGHIDLGELTEGLRLQPNVEVGLGDNRTLLAFNVEGLYFFDQDHHTAPYAGGGIGAHLVRQSGAGVADPKGKLKFDETTTNVGLNVLAGVERSIKKNRILFVEAKAGIDDAPDLKVTVGVTFKKEKK